MNIPFNLEKTLTQYDEIVSKAKKLALSKNDTYGQSWRIFRLFSLLEQVWIKLMRIRSIQEKNGQQKITDEPIQQDFVHALNYCVFGILLIKHGKQPENDVATLEKQYDEVVEEIKTLYKNKTHDYNEAWRNMAISSMVDIMLVKTDRGKKMHQKRMDTRDSLFEIFRDVFNYNVFCLIQIDEGTDPLL